MVVVFLIALPLILLFELVLLLLVVLALIMARRYQSRFNKFSCLSQREKFWLLRNTGTEEQLQICGVEYVSRWLIVLKARHLRQPGSSVNNSKQKTFRLPLFVDAMDGQSFHHLQLQARNGGF